MFRGGGVFWTRCSIPKFGRGSRLCCSSSFDVKLYNAGQTAVESIDLSCSVERGLSVFIIIIIFITCLSAACWRLNCFSASYFTEPSRVMCVFSSQATAHAHQATGQSHSRVCASKWGLWPCITGTGRNQRRDLPLDNWQALYHLFILYSAWLSGIISWSVLSDQIRADIV